MTGPVLIASLALIWGLTYVAITVALEGYSAALLSWVRAAGGVAVVLLLRPALLRPALGFIRRRPAMALGLGACNVAFPFWLIALGEHTVSSGATAVLLATSPALVAVAASRSDRSERLRARQWAGVGVATLGVAVTVGASPDQVQSMAGAAAILAAAGSYAAGSLTAKAAAEQSPWEQTVVTLLVGAALLAVPAAVATPDETPSLEASAALAALAVVGTALSLVLLFAAVRHGGAGYSLRPIYLSPAVSIAGGALILGDAVSGGLAAGFAMAVVGVALTTARAGGE